MITMFDFVYCQGEFSPLVVWYSVRVGISKRDQRARQFIEGIARCSGDILFARHDGQMSALKDAFAAQLAESRPAGKRPTTLLLRQVTVNVRALASMLRCWPAALLNSPAIPTIYSQVQACLAGLISKDGPSRPLAKRGGKPSRQSLNVKNLGSHGNKNQ